MKYSTRMKTIYNRLVERAHRRFDGIGANAPVFGNVRIGRELFPDFTETLKEPTNEMVDAAPAAQPPLSTQETKIFQDQVNKLRSAIIMLEKDNSKHLKPILKDLLELVEEFAKTEKIDISRIESKDISSGDSIFKQLRAFIIAVDLIKSMVKISQLDFINIDKFSRALKGELLQQELGAVTPSSSDLYYGPMM